jgi:hypothetical protein
MNEDDLVHTMQLASVPSEDISNAIHQASFSSLMSGEEIARRKKNLFRPRQTSFKGWSQIFEFQSRHNIKFRLTIGIVCSIVATVKSFALSAMNILDLQHAIREKESELARIRQAAVDATLQQEEKAKSQLIQVIESMEIEMERTRRESEIIIHQIREEAAASIKRAKTEARELILLKEEEMFAAARLKMEADWTQRENCMRDELNLVFTTELENQRTELILHYEAIIHDLNRNMKADEEKAAQNVNELNKEHQHQVKEMNAKIDEAAQIIWVEACQKISADAETIIFQRLKIAEEQCQARDEQISALLDDRCSMQKQMSEKEALIADMTHNLKKMECEQSAFASDFSSQHAEEMTRIMEDMADLERANDHLESEIHLMRSELSQSKLEYKSLENKCAEHKLSVKAVDSEKNRSESRIRELSALNQLLERELADATKEINDLTVNSEATSKKIDDLVLTNDENAKKVLNLTDRIGNLRTQNEGLERKHMLAVAQINALEQERRECKIIMDDRTKQSEKLLVEAIDSFKGSQSARTEPVVVHLHGNHGDSSTCTNMNEKLSTECNNLRSRVLHLQRENFRLESELTMTQSRQLSEEDSEKCSSQSLLREINNLKIIISAMRKDMENAAESNASEGNEKSLMLSHSILEQQLIQYRSYLDLLLMPREGAKDHVHGVGGGECAFLRAKYRELHIATDELREENNR